MTAPFVADALGPRGRRLTVVASAVFGVLLVAALVVALGRLSERGQLDETRWEMFRQWPVWRFYLLGLLTTIKVALIAMAGAMLIGAVMALARLSRARPVRWAAAAYVEFFRGVPLVLLVFFSYLGLPRYGVDISGFGALTLALVIYNGAVLGEIFRAGILSLDRGQSEAASSLGMTYWQSMLLVVVPQAARRMVPAIVSQLVTLLKDTSLGAAIGYEELLRRARVNGEFFLNPLQSLVVAAAMYIVVNFALSRLARWLEMRQRRRYRAGQIGVAGVEDLAVLQAQEPLAPEKD